MNKIISICADGASVMQGKFKGVVTQLKQAIITERKRQIQDIPMAMRLDKDKEFHSMYRILGVHCVCHRFALVLSDCISKEFIPPVVVTLLRKLYEYFSKSGKRKRGLQKVIKQLNDARTGGPMNVIEDPDDALEKIIQLEIRRVKLPKRVVLTRWLGCEACVNVIIGSRNAYALYFDHETTPESERIREQINNNAVFIWYYFLADIIPILTRMNVLFQSTLPLSHLLFEKVEAAKSQLILYVGQEPREELLFEGLVTEDTIFGPGVESFVTGCRSGNVEYGDNAGHLTRKKVAEIKLQMYSCVKYMLENLDARFPKKDLEIYKVVRAVDPQLRKRTKLSNDTHGKCVSKLLRMFEVPLHGFIEPKRVLQSHTVFMTSQTVTDLVVQCFVLDSNGNHDENAIYTFYFELMKFGGDCYEWCKFALFCLIIATGNAISERGFSAMSAVHSKNRSELGLDQVFASMLVAFNGKSYKDFYEEMNRDSTEL